jgi:hypothetical protein
MKAHRELRSFAGQALLSIIEITVLSLEQIKDSILSLTQNILFAFLSHMIQLYI